MKKIFIMCAFMMPMSFQAMAGYLPPPESPYWCYQACIDWYYTKHTECVAKCYGSKKSGFTTETQVESKCVDSPEDVPNETMAAACCSWGENITGCMPGC